MKGGKNLRELQQEKKTHAESDWIHQPVCIICKRNCEGYHGRHGDSGTCNATCEAVQAKKPKYPGYSEEDFLSRQNA